MTLQQLRYLVEVAQRGFNVSEAAEALFTSQPGVSKQIKQLENDLGIIIFERVGKRLTGVTEAGGQVLAHARRILAETENLKRYVDDYTHGQQGALVIATTHTQARYVLPKVVKVFKDAFPKVHLVLHQGSPAEIVSMLQTGQADIGIATEALDAAPEIATFPYYQWRHALIVPKGHPLALPKGLTLKDIAAYPIITYHEGYTGRGQLDKAFADEGLAPDIVMSALDADVIKAYVELGLGIGIVASMAYYAERDTNLSLPESEHLFRLNTTLIGVRRGHYLRGYAYKFIELCAAEHTEAIVRQQATQLA